LLTGQGANSPVGFVEPNQTSVSFQLNHSAHQNRIVHAYCVGERHFRDQIGITITPLILIETSPVLNIDIYPTCRTLEFRTSMPINLLVYQMQESG